jgi:hypothetical protein
LKTDGTRERIILCAVCLSIFTPRDDRPRFYCSEKCNKASYRIRRGNTLKRLNRKLNKAMEAETK